MSKLADIENIGFNPLSGDIVKVPEWYKKLRRAIKTSCFIILTGNIYDYVGSQDKVFARDHVLNSFADGGEKRFQYVLGYDIADNVQFLKGDSNKFIKELAQIKGQKAFDDDGNEKELDPQMPTRPFEVFTAIEKAFKNSNERILFVVEYSDKLNVNDRDAARLAVRLHKISNNLEFQEKGHVIILMSSDIYKLPQEFQEDFNNLRVIDILEPDASQRKEFIEALDPSFLPSDFAKRFNQAVTVSRGFSLIEIENVFLENYGKSFDNWVSLMNQRCVDIVSRTMEVALAVKKSSVTFVDNYGSENKKKMIKKYLDYMLNGRYDLVPQGMAFFGSPGTGKTYLLEAMANYLGQKLFVFGNIHNKFVGESERLVRKVLRTVQRFGGILAIDEMDQTGQRGEKGDAGVTSRIFRQLMQFASDSKLRGRVLIVIASNRPDLIDTAYKRDGRSSVRFAFLKPSQKDRVNLLVGISKFLEIEIDESVDFQILARKLVNYTHATIKELLVNLKARLYDLNKTKASQKDFLWVINSYPLSTLDEKEESVIVYNTLLAVNSLPVILGEDFDYSDEALFAMTTDSCVYDEVVHVVEVFDNAVKTLFADKKPIEPPLVRILKEIKLKIESKGSRDLETRTLEM